MFGRKKISRPVATCPLDKCRLVVYVHDTTAEKKPAEGVSVKIMPDNILRLTNASGIVELAERTPNVTYIASITLPAAEQKKYRLKRVTSESHLIHPQERCYFRLEVEKLARPRICLTCEETGEKVGNATITVGGVSLGKTGAVTGLAQLADDAAGIPPGNLVVAITLDAAGAKKFFVPAVAPQIAVAEGAAERYDLKIPALGALRLVVRRHDGQALSGRINFDLDLHGAVKTHTTELAGKQERLEVAELRPGKYTLQLKSVDTLLKNNGQAGLEPAMNGKLEVDVQGTKTTSVEFVFGTARPKVRVVRKDNKSPLKEIGVKLGTFDLGRTNDLGIAQLPKEHAGMPSGTFDVQLDLPQQKKDVWQLATESAKAKVEFGKDPADIEVKPMGALRVIVRRHDNQAIVGKVNFGVNGTTARANLAATAEVTKDATPINQNRALVGLLEPGDYTVQIDQLAKLLDGQKLTVEQWRIGPEKTGKAVVKVEPEKADSTEREEDNGVTTVTFTLTCYRKVQFIAFNIMPGTKTHLGTEIYLGDADASDDLGKRCLITKSAMETAYSQGVADPSDAVLKIFMAPEFYFRGKEGGYPVEYLDSIMEQLRPVASQSKFKNWLFCYGTAIGYRKNEKDYVLNTTGHTAGPPYDKLRVTTGKDNASNCASIVPGKSKLQFLGGTPDSKGIKPTLNLVIQSAALVAVDTYELVLVANTVAVPAGTVLLTQPSDKSEVFNVALVQKGGAAGSGTGLREAVIYKEYVSPIDFLGPNYGKDQFHTDSGRIIKIHAESRTVLPTTGSVDRLAESPNPTSASSEVTKSGLGGGSIFQVDGITFGLEVCLDHAEKKLADYYASHADSGEPKVQVQLIPSWGMSIKQPSLLSASGIPVFNVDGPAGSAAGVSEPGKYYCRKHPDDDHTAAGKCPKTDFYVCPTCTNCPATAFSTCPHCAVEIGTPIYYCGYKHFFPQSTANCPLCGNAGTLIHRCSNCGSTSPGPAVCHGPRVAMNSCDDSHVQDGPGNCSCGRTLTAYSRCWKHGPTSPTKINCPACNTLMVEGHFDLQAYKPATKGANVSVPDPAPNQPIPVVDPNRRSTAVKNVTAQQKVLFQRPGRIQVYGVLDVTEAEIV